MQADEKTSSRQKTAEQGEKQRVSKNSLLEGVLNEKNEDHFEGFFVSTRHAETP